MENDEEPAAHENQVDDRSLPISNSQADLGGESPESDDEAAEQLPVQQEDDSDYLEEQAEKDEDPDFDPFQAKLERAREPRPRRAAKSKARHGSVGVQQKRKRRKRNEEDEEEEQELEDESDIEAEFGPDARSCKVCEKTCRNLTGLLRHINMSTCKEVYGGEYEEMRKELRRNRAALNERKRRRAVYREEQGENEVDEEDDGTGRVYNCTGCAKPFKAMSAVLRHVMHSDECRDKYGEERLGDLKSEVRKFRYANKDAEQAEKERLRRFKNYYDNREAKLEKSREYYRRNRQKITMKKRLAYLKDDMRPKSARSILGIDAPIRPKTPQRLCIRDPVKAQGVVRYTPDETVDSSTCVPTDHNLPVSKIDHEGMDEDDDLLTMPVGSSLTGRFVAAKELVMAESFVGMCLSNDGESVEVKQLLSRQDVTLRGLQQLFHCLMAVIETDMKDIISDKGSPIVIVNHKNIIVHRNNFSKEIVDGGVKLPEVPKPICVALRTRETHFISPDMPSNIPEEQLLVNPSLQAQDMAAIGLELRQPDTNEVLLIPMFTVNMPEWRANIKYLFTVLVNWIGSKELLQEMVLKTPCGTYAKALIYQDVKEECYLNCLQPRKVSVCEHCGLSFSYNKYLFKEVARYKSHLAVHQTTCRVCGETFPTNNAKKYHQRTHNKVFFPCPKEGCKWVGNTQKSKENHMRFFHTVILCDLCGKEYSNLNSLQLHVQITHHRLKKPRKRDLACRTCGRVGYATRSELLKHERRHTNPDSNVNKWMHHKPDEYKYVCPMHENCKKYFKRLSYLRHHMKVFDRRDYPTNVASQYRPNIDDDDEGVVLPVKKVTDANGDVVNDEDLTPGYPVSDLPFPHAEPDEEDDEEEDDDDVDEVEEAEKPPKVPRFEFDQLTGASKPSFSNHAYIPGVEQRAVSFKAEGEAS